MGENREKGYGFLEEVFKRKSNGKFGRGLVYSH
jgi:hypothetical protein